jgi:hypothetical protein
LRDIDIDSMMKVLNFPLGVAYLKWKVNAYIGDNENVQTPILEEKKLLLACLEVSTMETCGLAFIEVKFYC